MHFATEKSVPQLHQNIWEGEPKVFINKVYTACAFQRGWIKYNQLPTLCSDVLELVGMLINYVHLFLSTINGNKNTALYNSL